ncbi:MAG: hypothetical protein WC926_02770 [Candidatus Paceibacterota bacterium]
MKTDLIIFDFSGTLAFMKKRTGRIFSPALAVSVLMFKTGQG